MSFHLHNLSYTGSSDRFAKNIDAITLLAELEHSGRVATDAERERLAHYSAFGESTLLNRLVRYDATQRRYVVHPQYASILSNDDVKDLRQAALTAFYTPLDVVEAVWSGLLQLGIGNLNRLRVVEPAFGVGHFFSAMPQDLRIRADLTAVERDPVTARIVRQIHPDITLHNAGFEDVDLPTNWFDLAISNVPFGDVPVHDTQIEPALRRTIHDYFFAKAVRIVRPGGVIAFLTSWGTLDKKTPTMRHWLARHCELLGAYRLPNGVFARMSGSASATDLLMLRKRPAALDEAPADAHWLDLAFAAYPLDYGGAHLTTGSRYREVDDEDDDPDLRVPVNTVWLNEPERIIGRPAVYRKHGALWLQVILNDTSIGAVLRAQLIDTLPTAIIEHQPTAVVTERAAQPRFLHERDAPLMLPLDLDPAQRARLDALATIYTRSKALIRSELEDAADVDHLRAELNRAYDDYVANYGCISDPRTQRLFRNFPELSFLLALEHNAQKIGDVWRADKEPIFFRRTLRPVQRSVAGTFSPVEALLRCLDEIGTLDMARIAHLCGCAAEQVATELGDCIYRIPGTTTYELADVYLSGNVRAKLREARTWAAHDSQYQRNVDALIAVQPADLGAGDIIVNLSSVWLPGDVLTAFIQSILPEFTGRVFYMHALGQWQIADADALKYSVEATSKWGTLRANALALLEASLKGVPVTVYDEVKEGNSTRRVLNPSETVAAQAKQSDLRTAFDQWIWADPERSERLCHIYNDRFNCIRLREYHGDHLTFPGMTTHLLRGGDLEAYQKGAVWQILQNPSTLLAFDVGGGKTWTSAAAMVEAKRMGLINKPLVVVPNSLVAQWASEVQRLYPGLRVLAMSPEDFEKSSRGIVLSRIATGDWDMIIIAHTSFKFLPLGNEVLDAFIDKETDRLRSYLEELRATAGDDKAAKRSLKQIEKTIKRYEDRLSTMSADIKRDNERVITWRELGVDALVVDEAHEFKNLFVPTKLTNIAGLPRANSQRALDIRIKTWDLLNHGGKVVFLTATPIMNTLGEAYVMQLYLQERELEAAGIHHFDEWVSLYAEAVMSFEMKPDGSGFRMNTRLGAFVNLPEMSAMWRQCMNIRTKAQMNLPEPSQVTGKPIPIEVPASEALKAFVHTLAQRADRIAHGQVDPSVDNMLKVTHEGRMAALDYRLIVPGAHRRKHNKIMACVKRVKAIYDTFEPLKGTQLIFCDLATPKGSKHTPTKTTGTSTDAERSDDGMGETEAEQRLANFVYYEIREELGKLGVPAHEVAFIHDAKTKAQRDALFAAMNDGRVRVLIGSTNKMSAGMNVQQRLIAEHNLDCPWRPGDLKQRYGRILRQGNLWPTVYIFTYVTPGSFDGYLWQLVEAKARFIEQGLAGEITARRVEDTSDVVLSAAEVKAIASGNPLVVKKVKLETQLSRLERIRAVQKSSMNEFGWKRQSIERDIADLYDRRAVVEAACAILAAHPRTEDTFEARVATQLASEMFTLFTQRKEAGHAVRVIADMYQQASLMMRDTLKRVVGRYRGLDIAVWVQPKGEVQLTLTLPHGRNAVTGFGATTDLGVFQSADQQLARVRVATIDDRIAERTADIAAIDDEVARLQVWDQQAQYDDLQEQLRLINAELSMNKDADPTTAPAANTDGASLDAIAQLLTLDVETEDDWAHPVSIPLAFEAMTLMHAETQVQAESVAPATAMAVGQGVTPHPCATLTLVDRTPPPIPMLQPSSTGIAGVPAPAASPVWNEVTVTSKKTKQPVAVQYSMF